MACNVVFGMVGTLLTLFYTDYVGVAAARTVGLIMLLSRFFDGFSDMIMGIIVEKTNSKWGKIKTMDLVDECTICAVCDPVIYCTAYDGSGSVDLYFCNL